MRFGRGVTLHLTPSKRSVPAARFGPKMGPKKAQESPRGLQKGTPKGPKRQQKVAHSCIYFALRFLVPS